MTNKVIEFIPKLREEIIPIALKIADLVERLANVGKDESQRNSIMSELENFIEESGGKLDSIMLEWEELWSSNTMLLERLKVAVESGRQAIVEGRDKLKKMKLLDRFKKWKSLREMQGNIDQFVNRVKELEEGGLLAVQYGVQLNAVKYSANATKQKMRDIQHMIAILDKLNAINGSVNATKQKMGDIQHIMTELEYNEEQLESLTKKKS